MAIMMGEGNVGSGYGGVRVVVVLMVVGVVMGLMVMVGVVTMEDGGGYGTVIMLMG